MFSTIQALSRSPVPLPLCVDARQLRQQAQEAALLPSARDHLKVPEQSRRTRVKGDVAIATGLLRPRAH